MEDIHPYGIDDDDFVNGSDNPVEWELAWIDPDDEVPFHIPRD